MKETKREYLPLYSYYDRSGIAKHLEHMAAKGWLLEKIGTYSWRYRRIEPKTLRFAVTYFPKATQFSPCPADGLETFREFCAEAGWVLAADNAQVQIFYNADPEATPIETDPEAEFRTIHASMKKTLLSGYWSLLLLSLFEVGFLFWQLLENPISQLSSTLHLNSTFGFLPLALLATVELIRYYRWRKRCQTALELGDPLPELRSYRWLSVLILVLAGIQLLTTLLTSLTLSKSTLLVMGSMLVFMFFMAAMSNSIRKTLQKLRAKIWVNMVVTFGVIIALTVGMMGGMLALIFKTSGSILDEEENVTYYEVDGHRFRQYHDELPLTVQELVPIEYENWSTQLQRDSSPLLTHIDANQRDRVGDGNIPDLDYEVVIVKAGFLYNLCKQDYIDWAERDNDQLPQEYWDEYRPVDSEPWGAVNVYQLYRSGEASNQFLICWPNRIAEISYDWDWNITSEIISVSAEKLLDAY